MHALRMPRPCGCSFNGALARDHYPAATLANQTPLTEQHPPSPAVLQRAASKSPTLAEPGRLRFATDRLPWQRSLRWEKPQRDRRLLWLGGSVAFLVTLFEIVGFGLGMRSWHSPPRAPQVISVVLIEPESALPPPPPEPEPPIVARPSRVKIALPEVKPQPPPPLNASDDSDAMHARMGEGGAVAAPQLFNPDGSVRIGGNGLPKLPVAPKTEREAAQARWAQIETRGNPLDCKKTRFAGAFAPDVSLGDKVAGKYLKWVGLADPEAIRRRAEQRAESGGCEPAK